MCEPTSIILGLTAATSLLSAGAAIQQGQAQANAANYRAAVARNNATTAAAAAAETARRGTIASNDAIARGKAEEARKRQQINLVTGRQRAVLGSSGALIDAGSGGDIQADTAALGLRDQLTIRNESEREALRIRTQAGDVAQQQITQQQGFTSQAALGTAAASQASTSGFLSAGQSLIGGATGVASKWFSFNQETGGIN